MEMFSSKTELKVPRHNSFNIVLKILCLKNQVRGITMQIVFWSNSWLMLIIKVRYFSFKMLALTIVQMKMKKFTLLNIWMRMRLLMLLIRLIIWLYIINILAMNLLNIRSSQWFIITLYIELMINSVVNTGLT